MIRSDTAFLCLATLILPGMAHSFGKYDSRNGDECRAQVNANYDARAAEMAAHGNFRGIASMNRRHRVPDLAECAQMDRQARESMMSKAYQKLSSAIESLKARGVVSADERRALAADHEAIQKFPPAPYREAYLRLYADYLRYESLAPAPASAAGTAKVYRCTGTGGQVEFRERPCAAELTQTEMGVQSPMAGIGPPSAQCKLIETLIDASREEHDAAVTALLPKKDADDVIRNEPEWRALNERRLSALSDMQWQTNRARMLGCAVHEASAGSAQAPVAAPVDPVGATPLDQRPMVNTAPLWQSRPSAARLSDGRVMWVGREAGDVGAGRPIARVWDPSSNAWVVAGSLTKRTWMHGSAIQLPSGRVIYVGIDGDRLLNCDAWEPASNSWHGCGARQLEYLSEWRVQLGLLPDGRAFAIANMHEALVFDEAQAVWTPWRAEWSTQGLTYGAPIRGERPLARIFDEAAGRWVEINDAGARFWQTRARGQGPRLLWDPKAGLWAYVFLEHKMGRDAQFLPDGCAISTLPLALFNPTTGKATPLTDPGSDADTTEVEMVVLTDGTVAVAGSSAVAGGPGTSFFHRRVSCSGFERIAADGRPIADGVASDKPTVASVGTLEPVQARRSHWAERVLQALKNNWALLLACIGPVLGYLVLRGAGIKRLQIGPSWVLRTLVYGLCAVFVVPAIWSHVVFSRAMSHRACEEDPKACLDPKSGILKQRVGSGRGYIPCRMVGVWSSRQGGLMHRVELKDDGTYAMEPNEFGAGNRNGYTGHWAVQGQNMVWRHSQGGGGLDENPILFESDTRFTLIEGNGRRTNFELIRAAPSKRCDP